MTNNNRWIKKWIFIVIIISLIGLFFRPYLNNKNQIIRDSMIPGTQLLNSNQAMLDNASMITIHLAGAVLNPGVYEVPSDWTVLQLLQSIELHPDASLDQLKLAQPLRPNSRIKVSYKKRRFQNKKLKKDALSNVKQLININTASVNELMTLSGIGPIMAKRIVLYRKQHGPFKTVNELTHVKGIGPKTIEKINDFLDM